MPLDTSQLGRGHAPIRSHRNPRTAAGDTTTDSQTKADIRLKSQPAAENYQPDRTSPPDHDHSRTEIQADMAECFAMEVVIVTDSFGGSGLLWRRFSWRRGVGVSVVGCLVSLIFEGWVPHDPVFAGRAV